MNYENEIKARIGEKRYAHTLRVMEMAIKLAEIHNIDIQKAKIAAYYHDCAKIHDREKLFEFVREYNLEITDDMKNAPQIIHSFLGAKIAEKRYNIKDKEILDAIKYHTTGRKNMTNMDKVIFLADYIEPGREFPGLEKVRSLSERNLDLAMLFALNNTISFLIEKNQYIAIETIKARNDILKNLEKNNEKIF